MSETRMSGCAVAMLWRNSKTGGDRINPRKLFLVSGLDGTAQILNRLTYQLDRLVYKLQRKELALPLQAIQFQ